MCSMPTNQGKTTPYHHLDAAHQKEYCEVVSGDTRYHKDHIVQHQQDPTHGSSDEIEF